ncbi:MAG: divalent-cation tolerance protein CutA [Clostridiales Family XIII bacterium]|jgi:periplasmic divalent cation tolerance protein|nr:divalent-cation tolerance protein CutA [Clostridiales Family XIII bacterium]
MKDNEYAVISTACANEGEAEKIAALLLLRGLAACVQMFPVNSRYVWKGELCADRECLLLIKCRSDSYPDIERVILENHSYELPEILLTPVSGGYSGYLEWMRESGNRTP